MRTAAQMTGGRYIFLTDDSGIGNSHAEPAIPCYHVTKFDGALVRMVESEMSGTHVQPKAEEIIRTVGNPQNGQCTTKDRGNVSIDEEAESPATELAGPCRGRPARCPGAGRPARSRPLRDRRARGVTRHAVAASSSRSLSDALAG